MSLGFALRVLIFMSVAFSVGGGYHWLIYDRLVVDPNWGQPWSSVLGWAIVVLALSIPSALVGERFLDARRARIPLTWPAMLWLGASFMLFSGVVITDVLYALTPNAVGDLLRGWMPFELPRFEVSRALAVVAATGIFTALGVRRAFVPDHKQVDVALRNWPEALNGLRIVQLTDIHIGPILTRDHARYLTERVNELEPDLVVITGDLVDGNAAHLADEVAPFGGLQSKLGTFFVTGNHDFYSGARSWCDVVESLGIEVLRNRHVELSHQGGSFALAGVDDHRGDPMGKDGGEDLDAALGSIRDGLPQILLAHDPATFRQASRMGVDLQISGHTHDGQIWPFRYAVRLTTKWVAGLYQEGFSQIYVSRGTGFWGPPIRVGAPSEITELVIKRG